MVTEVTMTQLQASPQLGPAQALQRLAADRDPAAWAALLDTLGPDIMRLTRALAGSWSDDAAQETFLLLRDRAGHFKPRGMNADQDARCWVLRVAANVSLSLLRKQHAMIKRENSHVKSQLANQQASPEALLLLEEQTSLVQMSLAELPEKTRSAIVLQLMSGVGFELVASELRIPVGTLKARVHRGLEKLRTILRKRGIVATVTALSTALPALAAESKAPDSRYYALISSALKPDISLWLISGMSVAVKSFLALAIPIAAVIPIALLLDHQQFSTSSGETPIAEPAMIQDNLALPEDDEFSQRQPEALARLTGQLQVELTGDETLSEAAILLTRAAGVDLVIEGLDPRVKPAQRLTTVRCSLYEALGKLCGPEGKAGRAEWAVSTDRKVLFLRPPRVFGDSEIYEARVRAPINLDVVDMPLAEIFGLLAKQSGIATGGTGVNSHIKITLKAENLPLSAVLDQIAEKTGYQWTVDKWTDSDGQPLPEDVDSHHVVFCRASHEANPVMQGSVE
jgi:RNA polymerase sigma-70 factor, ECF subfamily